MKTANTTLSKPLVSIVTSVFNNAGEIRYTIESVLEQQDVNIEYIVVDGASTDGTLEILRSYGDRIHKLVSEPDNGIYDGLNRGVALTTGDYIGFLHSDDIFADKFVLSRFFSDLNDTPKEDWPAAIYGDLVYVDKHNPEKTIRLWRSSSFSPNMLLNGWMPPHPTLYVRRNEMLSTGPFDDSLSIAADYKFILKLFNQPLKFKYEPGVAVKMRTGGASNRSPRAILNKMQEDWAALKSENFSPLRPILLKNLSKLPQLFRRGNV